MLMTHNNPVIEVRNLVRRYGHTDAVDGLSLSVQAGRCYGFFGRNGAGKTTTIKCLLNLLRPTSGEVRVFGMDPARDEVAVKSRISYVPDYVAFYPWMTVRDALGYFASFRPKWNGETERALLEQFRLDPRQKTSHLSKGQRTQLALVIAICPEPELLILDEPTSGLDPIVRREFIRTVIGAYQDGDPGRRTVFVSTHEKRQAQGAARHWFEDILFHRAWRPARALESASAVAVVTPCGCGTPLDSPRTGRREFCHMMPANAAHSQVGRLIRRSGKAA
jgi:ABC-2 type transport system ATP-binding protein